MIPQRNEKYISIKLNDFLINRLDALAKHGTKNRSQLMLSLVNIWLNVLENESLPGLFYIANLLRVREKQLKGENAYEHEFTESRLPEKPYPIKFSEPSMSSILTYMCVSHISRHLLLKTMIIVGIEELEKITESKTYEISSVEPKLHKVFSRIMKKGRKAFDAYFMKGGE